VSVLFTNTVSESPYCISHRKLKENNNVKLIEHEGKRGLFLPHSIQKNLFLPLVVRFGQQSVPYF
jgi:hypothetical protein